nr:ribosomal protein L7Ae/L30e/S12e/Gadd45 [Tanacetum cinerariifolium]
MRITTSPSSSSSINHHKPPWHPLVLLFLKLPKINIIPPKQLFMGLTQDDTKTPSPTHQLSSPSAPNAPSKTPSTKDTFFSSIDYTPKSPTSSTSPPTNGYLNSPTSPPLRVPPPPPTQENISMDIILTLSPITSLDDLGALSYSQETEGPYHTELPTPEEIHQFLQFKHVDSNRIIKSKNVTLSPNQVLTKELRHDLKRWNELIYENVFGFGGHRDHLPACHAHILYCILAEQQYNLAYFFVKRIGSARATPKAHLPYGMFLTRLFRHVMKYYPHLDNDIYDVVERVMRPLALRQTRRPRSDHGKACHSISSTFAHHNRGSSSR